MKESNCLSEEIRDRQIKYSLVTQSTHTDYTHMTKYKRGKKFLTILNKIC